MAGWTISGLNCFYPKYKFYRLTAQSCILGTDSGAPLRCVTWLDAQAMARAASQVNWKARSRHPGPFGLHLRFLDTGATVVIAVLNAKTGRGLQQSLSLHEPDLVPVLHFLWPWIQSEGLLFGSEERKSWSFQNL